MAEFWETKTLEEMTQKEWESLCDGCAKCCLVKLEDYDTGEIFRTDVACKLLDIDSCRCGNYAARQTVVNDCVKLDRENITSLQWLPDSCSYKLIDQGKPLPNWHHLLTGSRNTVHQVAASVKQFAISELEVKDEEIEDHIIQWVD